MRSLFYNTWIYAKFILKREKRYLIVWFAALFFVTLGQAQSFVDLYPTAQDRVAVALSMENPAIKAMMGPTYGNENYTLGALMSQQTLLFTATAIAIMNILLIIRNTGAAETKGTSDQLYALPVGRLFQIGAAMIVSFIVNIVFSLAIAVGLYAMKIESMDLIGSLTYGGTVCVSGLFFAAVSALMAQISPSGALGLSFGLLGISYFVRAVGDVFSETVALVSPLGMVMRAQVYVENDFTPIITLFLCYILLVIIAFYLNDKRDYGTGIYERSIVPKPTSQFLNSPFALTAKLLKVSAVAWVVGVAVIGVSFGAMLDSISDQIEKNDVMRELFVVDGSTLVLEQFVSTIILIMTVIGTIPCILAITKMNAEENSGRMEILISRGVSRSSILASYLVFAAIISLVLNVIFALGMYFGALSTMTSPIALSFYIRASLSYLPAMWFMIGLTVMLYGASKKWMMMIWGYYSYSVFVIYFGQMLKLPEAAAKLTSYGNIPDANGNEPFSLVVVLMVLVTIFMIVFGFISYRKRDIN